MKNAIVTGANGFIGHALTQDLQNHGVFVYAVVRPGSAPQDTSPAASVCYVECDLAQIESLPNLIKERGIDVFYHLAWQGVSGRDQSDWVVQLRNLEATLRIAELLPVFYISKFIGAGSLHELECLEEMSACEPVGNLGVMYKSAKLAANYMARVKVCSLGIDFLWPVIINAYGPGEISARLINSTIRKLIAKQPVDFTQGTQLYDFTYITDVAAALRLLGERGKSCGKYFIGSGQAKPLKEFLQVVGELIGPSVPLNFGAYPGKAIALPAECFDITALQEDTGYSPKITFEQGVLRTMEWIEESL